MKKSLLLIALLVISVSAYAAAPQFPDIPDLKLVIGSGLTPAFDLECFNTGDAATTWAQGAQNFAGLSSVSSSWVLQGGYGSATVGDNSYTAANEGGTGTATNKVKWSTYRINKLPKVGLSVGASATVNVGSYASGDPESFGSANAIIVSDPAVSATWVDADNIQISLDSAISAPVFVDVIASPVATPAIGYDQDKERIVVYPNLMTAASDFDAAADTTAFGAEISKATGTLMSIGHSASVADGAGTVGNGVMTLTAADANQSIKITWLGSNQIAYSAGQWYTARMKYFASGAGLAGSQIQTWNFSNLVGAAHVDFAANIVFGASSTWNWLEMPLLSNQAGSGYLQVQIKPSGALVVNVDEVQLLNAAPSLIAAERGCDYYGYASGDFDAAADTTGWAFENFNTNVTAQPSIAVAGGKLTFTFAGGGTAGIKLTAGTPGNLVTPAANVGKDVGLKAVVNKQSGGFTNVVGLWVQYVYGVTANGGADFFNGGQLIGVAEIQGLTDGAHYVVAPAKNAFYQAQFALKGNEAATITVDDVDWLIDNDDPNFGDDSLF